MSTLLSSLCLWAILLGGVLFLGMPTALAQQGKTRFAPAKIKQVNKINKSFTNCKKDALSKLQAKEIDNSGLETELSICKERFPGAVLFTECKQRALKTGGKIKNSDLASCRSFVRAASFEPKDAMPFFVYGRQLFFAGIGLNDEIPVGSLAPPNFQCQKVKPAIDDLTKAQYLLFGNHPRVFTPLANLRGPALTKTLGTKGGGQKGFDIAEFGRLFGDPTDTSGVVFFPSAPCDFESTLGETFSGLSTYYLLDQTTDSVLPYFGIAYIKPTAKVTTETLVKDALATLGKGYQVFKKNPHTSFIAKQNVTETDDEQDPKNLCKTGRPFQFVAVIQTTKDAAQKPEYVIFANIANLCQYGDRAAKRLIK